jgi:SAM-dependent methyltransferase
MTTGLRRVRLVVSTLLCIGWSQAHAQNAPSALVCCDAIFMGNVDHHFADPVVMTKSMAAALKPGGRVAVVDFAPTRGTEAPTPADRANEKTHGVTAESVARELKEAGLEVVQREPGNDRWFMVVATKH